MITQTELKNKLYYNPRSGEWVWIVKSRFNVLVGSVAGWITKFGYRRIQIDDMEYFAHRLAFLWMNGSFPKHQVDHINGIKDDNRWCNLREATDAQNKQNKGLSKRNKTGYTGVTHFNGRYRSQLCINRKNIHLGLFDTPEEAYEAYLKAKSQYHTFQPLERI